MSSYLESVAKLFHYYKSLGDKTLERLTFDELQNTINEQSNSIAVIVKHMAGNMLSRWTNFLIEDGEKDWRNRDQEFIDAFTSKESLQSYWNQGWTCLFNALDPLKDAQLEQQIFIRNQGHTVVEAINRQLAHYAYHIGQMVVIAKQIKGQEWESLSIPKGQSAAYNKDKFAKEKTRRHFTEDL